MKMSRDSGGTIGTNVFVCSFLKFNSIRHDSRPINVNASYRHHTVQYSPRPRYSIDLASHLPTFPLLAPLSRNPRLIIHPPTRTNAASSGAEQAAVPWPSDCPPTPASDCGGIPPARVAPPWLRARGREERSGRRFRCRRSGAGWCRDCWASFLSRGRGGSMGARRGGGRVSGGGGGGR